MKKLLIVIISILFICTSCAKQHAITAEQLTDFYKKYLTYRLDKNSAEDMGYNFATERMTQQVKERMDRAAFGIDSPLIYMAEVNDVAVETINATHLEDDWYMISYYIIKDKPSTIRNITLKAETKNGKLRITYLPHFACFPNYGDDLLAYPKRNKIRDISQDSPLEFLQSFYDVYLSGYCDMSLNLSSKLEELRSKYLTPNALNQFEKVKSRYLIDNIEGYDMLIKGIDFDAMWYNSVKVVNLGGRFYLMTYTVNGLDYKVKFTLKKSDNGYLIDSVSDNVW